MEDILEAYWLSYDPNIPLICMDEQSYQFFGEKREPIPMKPGKTAKEDYEYIREGICNIFMFTKPLGGRRHVHASDRRTKRDWALRIRELLEAYYPDVSKVRFVMDNLNTHAVSSLLGKFFLGTTFSYLHFPPPTGGVRTS
jgi:hypothetical protein